MSKLKHSLTSIDIPTVYEVDENMNRMLDGEGGRIYFEKGTIYPWTLVAPSTVIEVTAGPYLKHFDQSVINVQLEAVYESDETLVDTFIDGAGNDIVFDLAGQPWALTAPPTVKDNIAE